MKKILLFCGIAVLLLSAGFIEYSSSAQASAPVAAELRSNEAGLMPGEEITYLVRYGFVKLGEIRLKVINRKTEKGETIYNTIGYIDSYPGLPFVNLHQIYESKVNKNYFSNFFRGTVKKEEYTTFTEYYFDYPKKSLRVKKGKVFPFELWTDSTGIAETEFHDGLSIFYWARMNLGQKKTVKVPCFVNEEKVFTLVNYYSKPETMEIDAVDYKIPVWRLDGHTDFVSVFGLTGHFEGWFSQDEACIPIVAKLNVIIGKVTVELIKWNRSGWNPPKAES